MSTNRKTPIGGSGADEVVVTFRASRQLRDDYTEAVARDERTLSQAIRLHMAGVVADARAKGDLKAAA